MRHGKTFRKLNRTASHRTAMFANMAAALIEHEQIVTTLAEGQGAAADRREARDPRQTWRPSRPPPAVSRVRDEGMVRKLFETIGPRYAERAGGYTRVLKAGFRYGDNAPVAVIEFVDRDVEARGAGDRARREAAEATEDVAA
jgi:large subunit ribosomal protein L17